MGEKWFCVDLDVFEEWAEKIVKLLILIFMIRQKTNKIREKTRLKYITTSQNSRYIPIKTPTIFVDVVGPYLTYEGCVITRDAVKAYQPEMEIEDIYDIEMHFPTDVDIDFRVVVDKRYKLKHTYFRSLKHPFDFGILINSVAFPEKIAKFVMASKYLEEVFHNSKHHNENLLSTIFGELKKFENKLRYASSIEKHLSEICSTYSDAISKCVEMMKNAHEIEVKEVASGMPLITFRYLNVIYYLTQLFDADWGNIRLYSDIANNVTNSVTHATFGVGHKFMYILTDSIKPDTINSTYLKETKKCNDKICIKIEYYEQYPFDDTVLLDIILKYFGKHAEIFSIFLDDHNLRTLYAAYRFYIDMYRVFFGE